jgi:RNA-directed DNA polymerase
MVEAKPFSISKHLVVKAYRLVKANRGAAGVDGESLRTFEKDLKGNLYKVWNRMSSGSYFPPPVRLVEIPKGEGRTRPLGIPTVADRIAQMVAKLTFEPEVEPVFHPDSYGYRPGKSALDAVGAARQRCFRMDWVIDLDIRDFFGSLDHGLLMKAVKHHTDLKWIHLYVERWLKAPVQRADGTLEDRTAGTPQGGVISPLLANLFMHYAFDEWMRRTFPSVPFERYADDAVIHCVSLDQARHVLEAVRRRLGECELELHPEKTRIVYCKDDRRRGKFGEHEFDFLGYTFRPRRAQGPRRKTFVGFLPAMSDKAAKKIRATIRSWHLATRGNSRSLDELARLINPIVRGWVAYYGRFYRSRCLDVLGRSLTFALVKWAMRKYKRFRGRWVRASRWLGRVAARDGALLTHWRFGARPAAGR